jgi:hypothetical protein
MEDKPMMERFFEMERRRRNSWMCFLERYLPHSTTTGWSLLVILMSNCVLCNALAELEPFISVHISGI